MLKFQKMLYQVLKNISWLSQLSQFNIPNLKNTLWAHFLFLNLELWSDATSKRIHGGALYRGECYLNALQNFFSTYNSLQTKGKVQWLES